VIAPKEKVQEKGTETDASRAVKGQKLALTG